MLIDSHNHPYYHGLDAGGVIAEMDSFGIDLCWLLTWYLPPDQHLPGSYTGFNPANVRPDGSHAGVTLDDVARSRDAYPDRFVAGWCPCPTEGDAAALFETATRTHGIRICGEWSYRQLLDDPRAIELFLAAGECGAPVVLHIDSPWLANAEGKQEYQHDWYGGPIDALERALADCPNTVFVGHAPGYWRHISADAFTDPAKYPAGPIVPTGRLFELFDTYPNLWADLSAGSGLTALRRDPEHAVRFLTRYQDRMLYGRDAPGNALQVFLGSLDLPSEVRSKIDHRNATRLVPTEPRPLPTDR